MRVETHDVVVIGGGPAGMAAAVAAYDRGVRDVVILDREEQLGGILKQCIHSGFGLHRLGRELTGPEYAAVFADEVRARNIEVRYETMVTGLTADREVTAQSRAGVTKLRAGAVILATGCRERTRGALNIPGTRPAGVYTAGAAQKLMNCEGLCVGRRAVILGSGDIGLIMARRLSLEGAKVEAVCEIMPYSGGLARNIVQCLEDFGIPLCLSTTVAEIHGRTRVEAVTVAEVDEMRRIRPETRRTIPCDTLLLSVGLIPENELARSAGIEMDPVTGGARVNERRETACPGIFACGNALQVHDLVDYVSDEAELAGRGAADWLMGKAPARPAVETKAGRGVRYVLPQRVDPGSEEPVSLFWRCANPCGKVRYTVRSGDEVLASAVRPKAAPGEMETLRLAPDKLRLARAPITVDLEEL